MIAPTRIKFRYTKAQNTVFKECNAKFRIVTKGRRLGFTYGLGQFIIENMIAGVTPIIWVDTTQGNLDRYIERYFFPHLRKIDSKYWKWRQQKKELSIGNSVCDFRSADRPENIEGFGYRIIVLNEAGIILKNRYLWENAILPMTLDFDADVIIGGTPKGKKYKNEPHLYYQLFQKCTPYSGPGQNDRWVSFCYSSYHNPLLTEDGIRELEEEIPAAVRDQEIYGKFIDDITSKMFKPQWWRFFNGYPDLVVRKVQSWDTAFKEGQENDYSVCTTWLQTRLGYYLLDVWRGRVEFPELKRSFVSQFEKHHPDVVIVEEKASGTSLIQEMQRDTAIPIKAIQCTRDKIERANAITPLVESGRVFLPEKTPDWYSDFMDELTEFPSVEHDDQVDSLTQALEFMRGNNVSMNMVSTQSSDVSAFTGYAQSTITGF
jgi:predicted phage terminase large subunit-like protein